jgi:hypothetical protein
MALFEKKQQLSRSEMREALRKSSPDIPGGGGMISREERVKMEKEMFPKEKYGSYISRNECEKRIRNLEKEKSAVGTSKERTDIDRKIRYLKSLVEE